MLDAIRRARRHVGNTGETTFAANEMAVDAAVRALDLLGDATAAEYASKPPWHPTVDMSP